MSKKPFALSVKVVIRDDTGRCLLLRRSMSSKGNPGKWDLPGGKVDTGENFDRALMREVGEETGLAIILERVLGTAEFEAPTKRVICLILGARIESGRVHLSGEHDEYVWVDRRELPQLDLCEQFRPFAQEYSEKSKK